MIYLIWAEGSKLIKIGFTGSNDPYRRLSELQTSAPSKLRIIATTEGTVTEERAMHDELAEFRITGEWFEFSDCDAWYDVLSYFPGNVISILQRLGVSELGKNTSVFEEHPLMYKHLLGKVEKSILHYSLRKGKISVKDCKDFVRLARNCDDTDVLHIFKQLRAWGFGEISFRGHRVFFEGYREIPYASCMPKEEPVYDFEYQHLKTSDPVIESEETNEETFITENESTIEEHDDIDYEVLKSSVLMLRKQGVSKSDIIKKALGKAGREYRQGLKIYHKILETC